MNDVNHFIPDKTLFFDGHCVLCNAWARRIMKWDKQKKIHLAPIHKHRDFLLVKARLQPDELDRSVLYFSSGKFYKESDAIIKLLEEVYPRSPWVVVLHRVPRTIRNVVYRFIAANRFYFFKRRVRPF